MQLPSDGKPVVDVILEAATCELSVINTARQDALEGDSRQDGWLDRCFELIDLIEATEAETPTGLRAKAQALVAEGPDSTSPSNLERLALSLAKDVVRLLADRQAG